MLISIVLPVFNEAQGLEQFIYSIKNYLKSLNYEFELVFVDDGSEDKSAEIISKFVNEDNIYISLIKFSKNFGHQVALRAGYNYSKGEIIICMDSDFQHPFEMIEKFIQMHHEGYEIVSARRDDSDVQGQILKKTTSKYFYKFWSWIVGIELKSGSSDFRMISRKVLNNIKMYKEQFLFIRGLIPNIGFRQGEIYYSPNERLYGSSKYTMKKMLKLSKDALLWGTIRPLRLSIFFSFIISLVALFFGFYAIYAYFFIDGVVNGWASTIAVISFIGALQLFILGVIGEYLGHTLQETRNRPIYHIDYYKDGVDNASL